MDAVYGADAVNVEAQCRNPGSFLHWLRGMLIQRRAMPVLGVGAMEHVSCPNPSVLAYVRSGQVADAPEPLPGSFGALRLSGPLPGRSAFGDPPAPAGVVPVTGGAEELPGQRTQRVLCVHNLSRFAQPAELVLARWAGATPVEVLGRVPFPAISDEPYTITLAPYGYMWFELHSEGEGRP
jgi:maltose alpha-D-glucosyltransferase/alpha-amylase